MGHRFASGERHDNSIKALRVVLKSQSKVMIPSID